MTTNELLEIHYIGKILVSSGFYNGDDTIWDCMDNKVEYFSPFGKKITSIEIGFNSSREDAGILITVEGYDIPFFFYANESLVIESQKFSDEEVREIWRVQAELNKKNN